MKTAFIIVLLAAATNSLSAKNTFPLKDEVLTNLEALFKEEQKLVQSMQDRFARLNQQIDNLVETNVNEGNVTSKKSGDIRSLPITSKRSGIIDGKKYRLECEFPGFHESEITINVSDHDHTVRILGNRKEKIAKKAHGFAQSFYHEKSTSVQEKLPNTVDVQRSFSKTIENGLVILEFNLKDETKKTLKLAEELAKQDIPTVVSRVEVVRKYTPEVSEQDVVRQVKT